ncbi:MAG: mechanosensitive ion channel family protein [Ruminococcaceae bacterium]|nr:mechanosensitive ion channel family protein [Oscillospiraceae bacterium]
MQTILVLNAESFLSYEFFGNPISSYLVALAILLAAFLLRKLGGSLFGSIIKKITWRSEATGTRLSEELRSGLRLLTVAVGFGAATNPLLLKFPESLAAFLGRVTASLFVVAICLLLAGIGVTLTGISQDLAIKRGKPTSTIVHVFYRRAIQVAAVILALFMLLKTWGFDISGLLAGIGIGGLALSLAAQDTFANLLGGITIMADRVFEIGDYIATPDIDGIVEEIGFRSSRIRTLGQAVVTVPNGKLSNSFITNYSRMGKRRIRIFIPIANSTSPEKLTQLTERLKEVIGARELIFADSLLVIVENISSTALNILIQCYVNEVDYALFLEEQQAVLMLILENLRELKIEFSYPTPITPITPTLPEQPVV